MSDDSQSQIFETSGPVAPPRQNGELIFSAPWESRVFGLAVALQAQGRFDWEEFRQCLIAEISDWDHHHRAGAEWNYYERWQTALEKLLTKHRLCSATELDDRERALAARPAGHDHSRSD